MNNKKAWLITGASKGLGFELTNRLLEKGHSVIATSRNADKLKHLQDKYANLLPLSMEVIEPKSIEETIAKGLEHFGRIDIIVNNAGYGLLGTLEEFSETEIKNVFDVNVFGVYNVCKAILPVFRNQKSGHILNIASVSASFAAPTTGIYSATKAAVLQLSEALAKEVEEFGIKVTAICPGGFRTDFLDKSSMMTPKNRIEGYTLVNHVLDRYAELNKNQGGDPKKAADVFIQLTEMENPPTRFYLGSDALRMMDKKLNEVQSSIDENEQLSKQADFN